MEKVIVQYLPEVESYLNELIYLLFQKEYFGYLETALDYVDDLINFIDYNISIFPPKNTPLNLIELGSIYIFYKANNHTTWFIFFENFENRFLVTYITNNHTEIVKFL